MTITTEYRDELQRQHSAKAGWGSTAHKYTGGEVLQQLFVNGQIQEVLDYGCGKQALKPFIHKFFPNIAYFGYDPGIHQYSAKPAKRFGLVTNIDVLEHIEEGMVDSAIKEMADLTKYTLLLDIACYPTGRMFDSGPYTGEDIHITVREPQWWHDKVVDLLGDEFFVGKYCPSYLYPMGGVERSRCLMILHRTG
jgi:hypothetical protein